MQMSEDTGEESSSDSSKTHASCDESCEHNEKKNKGKSKLDKEKDIKVFEQRGRFRVVTVVPPTPPSVSTQASSCSQDDENFKTTARPLLSEKQDATTNASVLQTQAGGMHTPVSTASSYSGGSTRSYCASGEHSSVPQTHKSRRFTVISRMDQSSQTDESTFSVPTCFQSDIAELIRNCKQQLSLLLQIEAQLELQKQLQQQLLPNPQPQPLIEAPPFSIAKPEISTTKTPQPSEITVDLDTCMLEDLADDLAFKKTSGTR